MISQSGSREATAFVQGEMTEARSERCERWRESGGVRHDEIADE